MDEQSMQQVGIGKMNISDSTQAMADALPGFKKKGLRVLQFIRTPIGGDTCFVHALCEKVDED